MITESGQNGEIRLYKAVDFPWKWKLEKILAQGANFVDTSFVRPINGTNAIITTMDWDKRATLYYGFDLETMYLSLLPDNPLMMNERNAGNAFVQDGITYRVLQDCSSHYGTKIMIRELDNLDFEHGLAADSQVMNILPSDLRLEGNTSNPLFCHTYNRSKTIEVVDYVAERFSWVNPIYSFRNWFFFRVNKRRLKAQ